MKVGIYYSKSKSKNLFDAKNKFENLLFENKIEYFDIKMKKEIPDLLVVFGGDGTVLNMAQFASENNLPIIAVNVGTVGFLSSFEESEIEKAVDQIKDGKFTVVEKTTLEIETSNGEKFFALNDAVIERVKYGLNSHVVAKIQFYIEDNFVYDLSADGIIISTPTGSTAYSLSAGGVILSPETRSFIATPICSHSLNTRPIVYSDEKEVSIVIKDSSCGCVLCADGRAVKDVELGEKITVRKGVKPLKIVDYSENFIDRLKQKLGR